MTPEQLFFYDLCIDRVNAEEEIFLRNCESELSPDRVYDLVLKLTGDQDEALRRKAARWLEQTRSENT